LQSICRQCIVRGLFPTLFNSRFIVNSHSFVNPQFIVSCQLIVIRQFFVNLRFLLNGEFFVIPQFIVNPQFVINGEFVVILQFVVNGEFIVILQFIVNPRFFVNGEFIVNPNSSSTPNSSAIIVLSRRRSFASFSRIVLLSFVPHRRTLVPHVVLSYCRMVVLHPLEWSSSVVRPLALSASSCS
jgi:hypothetical protein